MKILVVNGPNINLLGRREPGLYGHVDYAGLCEMIAARAAELGVEAEFFQSNHEGAMVDALQQTDAEGIIINPAAYTHTSVALLDVLKAICIPAVEVHITDPDAREDFRHISYVRAACIATVKGKGVRGYIEALEILAGSGA